MSAKAAPLSVLAVALVVSLAACSREETTTVEAETAPVAPAAPVTEPVVQQGAVMVPEMKPTGELAPSFGAAPVGSQPAAPTGSKVPEMTPTGQMKPAVNPNQPSQPAAAPAK